MSKLDELIAATLAASKPQGCWASRLEGGAAKYVTALREEEKKGNKASRVLMRQILAEAFGVRVSEERIRAHMNRTCNCE
jgi:hypothetical protein